MQRRSPARFLAPIALVAAFIAVFAVVNGSDSGSDSGSGSSTTPVTHSVTTTTTKARPTSRKPKQRSYIVKSGDVLSAIAERTGVSLARIVELNPDLDPQALQAGQKIKLTR